MKTLVLAALSAGGAVQIGRMLVGGILKFVPLKGSVAGAVISAPIASAITYVMGKAFVQICIDIENGKLSKNAIASAAGLGIFKTYYKN